MAERSDEYRLMDKQAALVKASRGKRSRRRRTRKRRRSWEAPTNEDGDTPIIYPFALNPGFWRSMGFSLVAGVIMGFVSLGFLNLVEHVPLQWYGPDYLAENSDSTKFGAGHGYWILITTATGFVVGVVRFVTGAPDFFEGFFRELRNRHAEPRESALAVLISGISLCGGASMGPEAGLVAAGGGFGVGVARLMKSSKRRSSQYALIGMVAACGALFPTPFQAILIVHELGKPDPHFLENAMLTGVSATVSFAVFFAFKDETWLQEGKLATTPGGASMYYHELQLHHLGIGGLIGILGGILGTMYLIIMGIFKVIGIRLRARIDGCFKRKVGKIFVCTLGGLLMGILGYIQPLVLGSGMTQISPMVTMYHKGYIAPNVLVGVIFLKCIAYGISYGFGFVGGIFFPTVFMGGALGLVLNAWDENTFPLVLSLSCGLASVPGSFCSCPFTIIVLVQGLLVLGSYEVAPIFCSLITSYLTLMGIGIIYRLEERQRHKKEGHAAEAAGSKKRVSRKRPSKKGADGKALDPWSPEEIVDETSEISRIQQLTLPGYEEPRDRGVMSTMFSFMPSMVNKESPRFEDPIAWNWETYGSTVDLSHERGDSSQVFDSGAEFEGPPQARIVSMQKFERPSDTVTIPAGVVEDYPDPPPIEDRQGGQN